jgi:DNA-binding CsgD family transcriptional regulator/tetratricopeptide (TPR) repeat protein
MDPGASRRDEDKRSFVAREIETRTLMELLKRAGRGRPVTALVRGEAGVGKSRLLREFARQAGAAGAKVMWGSCIALGAGEIPYAPLIDALRRLVRGTDIDRVRELAGPAYPHLVSLLPGEVEVVDRDWSTADHSGERTRLFAALLGVLDRLGRETSAVLVVEDLHWADQSTVDFLSYFARARVDERLMVVGSLRTEDVAPQHPVRTLVSELQRAQAIEVIDLARFEPDGVREYLRAAIGAEVSHDMVERAHDLTDGNAFFLEKVVAAGTLTAGDDASAALPATVEDLLLPRFELLGEDARAVMGVAAVVGRRASHHLLAAVCELPENRLLTALRACVASEMMTIGRDGHTYRFHHPLLREVVYWRLIPGDRLRLHRAIAVALAADGDLGYVEGLTVAAELSYHWFEARAFPEALAAAVAAGDHAMRVLAFREASRQFDRAVRVWPDVADAAAVAGTPSYRLRMRAAEAARWSGRLPRAVELIRAAIVEVDEASEPVVAGEMYERLGSYLWELGDHAAADTAYARAVSLLEGTPDSAAAARVLAVRATECLRRGVAAEGLPLGQAALDMARRIGARAEEGRALNSVGLALTMTDRIDDGIAALEEALQIAADGGQIEDLYRAYGNLVLALNHSGLLERGLGVAMEGLERIREAGLTHTRGRSVLANNASESLLQLGRWDEATSVLEQVLREVPETAQLFPRLTLAVIKVGQGQFSTAERLLAQVQAVGTSVGQPWFIAGRYACTAEMAIWQSNPETARAAVLAGLEAVAGADGLVEPLQLCALGLRNEADERLRRATMPGTTRKGTSVTSSAVDELTALVDRLADSVDRTKKPEPAALVALARAERVRADRNDTPDDWVAVADQWLVRPYPRAYALLRAAEAGVRNVNARRRTGGDGRVRSARTRAHAAAFEAHEISLRLHASPLQATIEQMASGAGLDLAAAPGPAKHRPPAAPAGLTPRELVVLKLVTAGRTNKQIAAKLYIAEKTAGVHVSNILRKLGVQRRGEAQGAAKDLGLDI